jgi:dTDP-4-dehydrorhamnose reductase
MQYISNPEMQKKEIFGIYNLTNNGKTTWYGFAKAIREQMLYSDKKQKLANILPINSDEYPLPAKRPKNSVLLCEKLESNFVVKTQEWEKVLNSID